MTQAQFSVHLGGGLYMDSNGVLSHGPELGKPLYSTPGGGLPVNLATLEKTFAGLAKALPNSDDPKSREKFDKILNAIGMLAQDKENLIGTLQAIGAVASVIGSVVPIVGAALAVLTLLLGLFKDGPSAVELLITRRFDDLERLIKTVEVLIEQRDLRDQRVYIQDALAELSGYLAELKKPQPVPANILNRLQDMGDEIDRARAATRILLDSSTWLAPFDQNEFRWVWPLIPNLYTFPRESAAQRANYPAAGALVFDHALMVPLSSFAVTSYLALLRALAPEFRSTGDGRGHLWDFAKALETLAENMRREGLARTVYTAADFSGGAGGGLPWGLSSDEVVDFSFLGAQLILAPGSTRWTVGAMDLRVHNDTYFTPGFSSGRIQHSGDQYAKQGLLNVRWIPPAVLEGYDEIVPTLGWEPANHPPTMRRLYRIVNPEECAQAANAQAEANYADLLYSSGYLNLIHLVAVLRNEATDPEQSQTVRASSYFRREPGTAVPVLVESEPILLTGVISGSAQREPQDYRATVSLSTQPLGRNVALSYRVFLRTLGASYAAGGSRWSEQEYRYFHQTEYADDPAHAGSKKLVTSTGLPLAELELLEGVSPVEVREAHGTAVLNAHTYDWWIPIKGFPQPFDQFEAGQLASLRAAGWEASSHAPASAAGIPQADSRPLPAPLANYEAMWDQTLLQGEFSLGGAAGWLDAAEPPTGQHRKGALNEVHLDYTLNWQGDQMTISLKNNRPQDRNYVVYFVVEETLGSGAVLHTTQRVSVIGQLTYVPQSFFDEEAEAFARLSKTMQEFARRYAISVGPRPGSPVDPRTVGRPIVRGVFGLELQQIASDPVLRELELAGTSTPHALERLATIAAQHPPAAELLKATLQEAGVTKAIVSRVLKKSKN